MRLKYNRQIKNKQIMLEVEAVEFSKIEVDALKRLGDPVIRFEEIYGPGFGFSVDRKLNPNFKIRIKVDGSKDIEGALDATNNFLESLQVKITEEMEIVMNKIYIIENELEDSEGYLDILY